MQPRSRFQWNLIFAVLAIAIVFSSCGGSRIVSSSKLRLMRDFCAPVVDHADSVLLTTYMDTSFFLEKDTRLGSFLSSQDILMARATGTVSMVKNMLASRLDTSLEGRLAFLNYDQQIQRNLFIVRSQIDAISAELDCEAGRTRELANYLGDIGKKRNTKLTVGAILAGSVSTMAPVF